MLLGCFQSEKNAAAIADLARIKLEEGDAPLSGLNFERSGYDRVLPRFRGLTFEQFVEFARAIPEPMRVDLRYALELTRFDASTGTYAAPLPIPQRPGSPELTYGGDWGCVENIPCECV